VKEIEKEEEKREKNKKNNQIIFRNFFPAANQGSKINLECVSLF